MNAWNKSITEENRRPPTTQRRGLPWQGPRQCSCQKDLRRRQGFEHAVAVISKSVLLANLAGGPTFGIFRDSIRHLVVVLSIVNHVGNSFCTQKQPVAGEPEHAKLQIHGRTCSNASRSPAHSLRFLHIPVTYGKGNDMHMHLHIYYKDFD